MRHWHYGRLVACVFLHKRLILIQNVRFGIDIDDFLATVFSSYQRSTFATQEVYNAGRNVGRKQEPNFMAAIVVAP